MIDRNSNLLAATLFLAVFASPLYASTDSSSAGASQDSSAIINGSAASTQTYPWMAFLADDQGEQYCGASLISPTWVLTAAHCFLNATDDAVDIETGAQSTVVLNSNTVSPLASNAINASIARIIVHPDYDPNFETSPNANDRDIALVELTESISLTPVQLLGADAAELAAGTQTRIMGWGTTAVNTDNESINPSNELLEALQQTISTEDCGAVYGDLLTDNMLCANSITSGDTTDTCQGDSGGPLVVANGSAFAQIGIVSFGGTESGPTCGDPEAPGVYTKVSAMASFIQQSVSDATFVTLGTSNPPATTPTTSALSVVVNGTNVTISWTEASTATGYRLYYAPYPAQTPISSLDLGPSLNVTGELPVGSAFYVAVEPYNSTGALTVSNIEVLMVQSESNSSDTSMLTAAEVEAACVGDFDTSATEDPLTLQVDGTRAIFRGLIDGTTPAKVSALINNNPEVKTIVLAYGPGSADDDANLEAALLVNQAGLGTCVPANGEINSGAVDFFLAGVVRRLGENSVVGVHSWADGNGTEGSDLPQSDPQHQSYLSFYEQIGISADFYWFTLEAAPADGIHNMTAEERVTYNMETP